MEMDHRKGVHLIYGRNNPLRKNKIGKAKLFVECDE
jgi:hypothetical protein